MAAATVAPSFALGSSFIAKNNVVTVTRNLSYPTRNAVYPTWTNEEKPVRLFTHEECRISPSFRYIPDTPVPQANSPAAPPPQNNGNTPQGSRQHTVLGPAWCLAVIKRFCNFGHRMFSQL